MAQLQDALTVDFSDGMYDSVAPARYPSAAVAELLNARIQPDGTLRRRSGSIRTHSAALNSGTTGFGGTLFRTAGGTDQFILCVGDKAYKSTDYGVNWTQIATSLRTDYYSFATMRVGATNYLFAANGDTTVKRWDGTTWDTCPNAPSGVKYLAVFNSRLYATGHSGALMQASKIADPTVWASPNGLTINLLTHAGDEPMGLYQIGEHLLVWDRHATSYIDGFGEQTIVVATGATGFSRSVGCVGFRTIAGVGDNGVCWLSERGVEYYSPSTGITLVSKAVQEFTGTIDWEQVYANPGRASAVYDSLEQNYHLALSTAGSRNNRVLVLNLLQNVSWQRKGTRAAASLDRPVSASGDVLFTGDANGYLTDTSGSGEADADANGYMQILAAAAAGDPVAEDANGYLANTTDASWPASLFLATTSTRPVVIYSIGYDGFVRRHYGVNSDDLLSDSSGGSSVTMIVISRPFLFKNPRQRKRVRAIHVASIQDAAATVNVRLRGKGTTSTSHALSVVSRGSDHADRKRALVHLIADAPQIEMTTTDDVRLAMLGVSAELLREPV